MPKDKEQSGMKIKDAKVFVCSPGRNFVTLKIYTDQGIYGLGDATLNGRELAVASYLTDHVIPCLIGRDPFQTEDIWQYLYRGAYWRKGPVTMSSIAAIDMALWDIKGKALNTPIYNLLGGKCRTGVMVYSHANGRDISETVDEVGKYIDKGFLAVRAQSGIPGLPSTYGVSKSRLHYEPAERGLPPETTWSSEKYLNYVPKLFEKLRSKYGDDIHLLRSRSGPASSPFTSSGSKTRLPPSFRQASASSASTRPRLWRSARSSTLFGTPTL